MTRISVQQFEGVIPAGLVLNTRVMRSQAPMSLRFIPVSSVPVRVPVPTDITMIRLRGEFQEPVLLGDLARGFMNPLESGHSVNVLKTSQLNPYAQPVVTMSAAHFSGVIEVYSGDDLPSWDPAWTPTLRGRFEDEFVMEGVIGDTTRQYVMMTLSAALFTPVAESISSYGLDSDNALIAIQAADNFNFVPLPAELPLQDVYGEDAVGIVPLYEVGRPARALDGLLTVGQDERAHLVLPVELTFGPEYDHTRDRALPAGIPAVCTAYVPSSQLFFSLDRNEHHVARISSSAYLGWLDPSASVGGPAMFGTTTGQKAGNRDASFENVMFIN